MKKCLLFFICLHSTALSLLTPFPAFSHDKNPLEKCWQKQASKLENNYLTFNFEENKNNLYHSFKPWQTYRTASKGLITCSVNTFYKTDSIANGKKTYLSKEVFHDSVLLFLNYGEKKLTEVNRDMVLDETMQTCRYNPSLMLNYFHQRKPFPEKESDKYFTVYMLTINKVIVKLYVRNADNQLEKITALENDETMGDVLSIYHFNKYSKTGPVFCPTEIDIEKQNGKAIDTIKISAIHLLSSASPVLEMPADYKIQEPKRTKPEISVENYNDHINFINLKQTNDRVLLVEFKDFLLVAEAPLNSENGELIIRETRKIAPTKPIRYFAFGHFHPHYMGGIRAFISNGSAILCTAQDTGYVSYMANTSHSLVPDSLYLHPRPFKTESIDQEKTISDGSYEMKIYFIGTKSGHTNDYLVYYFPAEKLLFEDDLAWIYKDKPLKKAGKTQSGLYNSIKDLGIEVKTIIQSWPVNAEYNVKTEIPFEELEKTVKMD